jgi:hypothetical protein
MFRRPLAFHEVNLNLRNFCLEFGIPLSAQDGNFQPKDRPRKASFTPSLLDLIPGY